jgi:hypothetical protein
MYLQQLNSTTSEHAFYLENAGTGHGLYLNQNEVLASGKFGIYLYSDDAQVNSALMRIYANNASTTTGVAQIINVGTGDALYVNQGGVLASGKYGLYVYSNAIQTNSDLVRIRQDNASSTHYTLAIECDGGPAVFIDQNSIYAAFRIESIGTSIQVDIDANSASSVYGLHATVDNAGSGDAVGILIDTGSGTGNKIALQFAGAEVVAAAVGGANTKKFRVEHGGTIYYVPMYTA